MQAVTGVVDTQTCITVCLWHALLCIFQVKLKNYGITATVLHTKQLSATEDALFYVKDGTAVTSYIQATALYKHCPLAICSKLKIELQFN